LARINPLVASAAAAKTWTALIAAFVFLEKLLPGGRLTSRLAGAALIVVGNICFMF
jgi:predicted metal-binding membrane protein